MSSPEYEIQILGRWGGRSHPPIAAEVCGKNDGFGFFVRQDVTRQRRARESRLIRNAGGLSGSDLI